ncbi:MAG: carboxypeptidase regulatory-like domain-containing protein, partial [Thermoanaerobaculia bacterium]
MPSGELPEAAAKAAPRPGPVIPSIEVRHSLRNVTSRRLSQVARPPQPPPDGPLRDIGMEEGPTAHRPAAPRRPDPVLQSRAGLGMPSPVVNFEGVANVNHVQPADTTMAIGPNHIFQWVNLSFQVFDKSGTSLAGPFDGNTLFTDLGGDCAAVNGGDIIVMYDQFADRWFLTQLAPAIFGAHGNHQCIAVSTSGDPLGSYYLYDYLYGDALNDYPKFGMWPDAYYMTAREFGGKGGFTMTVTAFDRTEMLNGQPFTAIFVSLNNGNFDGLLPADLDGPNPPPGTVLNPDGSASFAPEEIFMGVDPANVVGPDAVIHMYKMHPDFATPANSTLTGPVDFPIAPYNQVQFFSPVPQPPPGAGIEALGWILYRLPYRNFGTHESLVLYHDVNDEVGRFLPRWYEFRDPYGEPIVYQQSTYGPDDGVNRWMGSVAMDGNGNIAVGYSVSDGTSTFPGIRYAGRLATDPLNELTQGEAELIAGTGAFQGHRWGDYSTTDIDPTDDCTFWYTQMYIGVPGLSNWQTRVGSFKFPSCFAPGYGTVEGTVSDGINPLAGVHIGVTGSIGGGGSNTDASGHYAFDVPAGTYSLTATKYGYTPSTQGGVVVTVGGHTTQDFVLSTAPSEIVHGTVTDGSGGNWPLYARLVITAPGAPVFTLFTDPVTGSYAIPLVTGNTFKFVVTAVSPGYGSGGGLLPLAPAGGGGVTANWTLTVNPATCDAPGYGRTGLSESFDGGVIPPGWSLVTTSGGPWSVVSADPCGAFGNTTGGSGPFALANSQCDGAVLDDNELHTPSVNMSGFSTAAVAFNSSFFTGAANIGDVDISTDGGSNWTNVFRLDSVNEPGPIRHTIDITGIAAGQSDVRARFHLYNAFSSGWWEVDNAFLGDPTCVAGPGGLVVGNVLDANTGLGLNGATVADLPQPGGDSTTTFATPADPAQPDGMYILFAPSGPQSLMASLDLYTPQTGGTTVIAHGAVRLNFNLPTGRLDASPRPLSARVNPGQIVNGTLDMINSGGASADFELVELDVPPPFPPGAAGRFVNPAIVRDALARVPADQRNGRSAAGLAALPGAPRSALPLAAGNVVNAYPTQLVAGWGIAFNTDATDFWVSNSGQAGGDNLEYRYLTDGSQTGETIDDSAWVADFAADGAFNARTGMLWRVNVGGDNCIYELDPFTRAATGNKICALPWSGVSQRGLAYDVLTDTYYVGGWNEGVIYHIDGTGAVLDSTSVAIPISGLAYNSRTGHLFALTNHGAPPRATLDVFVFDAKNGMTVVGAFNVTQNGQPVPGLLSNGGAGMEIDCNGHLWIVDQADQLVLEVVSGESNVCAFNDIPWLSESLT